MRPAGDDGPHPAVPSPLEGSRAQRALAAAPALVVLAAISTQAGAALATKLFDDVGALGAAWLRSVFAGLVLAVAFRRVAWPRGPALRSAVALGVVLAAMNACIYLAIERIPLGVAVTAEFVGPLAVAVIGSRRPLDLAWVVLAGAGVALLGSPGASVEPLGLGLALAAGGCWALYIAIGKRLGSQGSVRTGLATSVACAAVLLAPAGVWDGGSDLGRPGVLVLALGVGVLSTALPYFVELVALRRVRASTFAILLSLQPAVAALVGLAVLGQQLHGIEWLALVLVVAASLGANGSSVRSRKTA